jgi:hypothetical protein
MDLIDRQHDHRDKTHRGSDGDAPDDDGVREPAGPAPGRVGSSVLTYLVPPGVHAPYSGAAPTGVLPPGEQLDAVLLRAKEMAQRHTLEHAERKRNRFGFGEPAKKMKATQKQLDARCTRSSEWQEAGSRAERRWHQAGQV